MSLVSNHCDKVDYINYDEDDIRETVNSMNSVGKASVDSRYLGLETNAATIENNIQDE